MTKYVTEWFKTKSQDTKPNLIFLLSEYLISFSFLTSNFGNSVLNFFEYQRELPPLPFDKNKFITFGSFNNFLKISDEVIRTWSKILKKIKNSKLILKSSLSYQIKNIISKFKYYGVENQLEFFDKQNYFKVEEHLKLYNHIDICLDTFPYNGVTTTFEALWSGVPVIVMKGFNFNSRCGESIVKNGNLNYFLAVNENDYIEKAVTLTNDIAREIEKEFEEEMREMQYL